MDSLNKVNRYWREADEILEYSSVPVVQATHAHVYGRIFNSKTPYVRTGSHKKSPHTVSDASARACNPRGKDDDVLKFRSHGYVFNKNRDRKLHSIKLSRITGDPPKRDIGFTVAYPSVKGYVTVDTNQPIEGKFSDWMTIETDHGKFDYRAGLPVFETKNEAEAFLVEHNWFNDADVIVVLFDAVCASGYIKSIKAHIVSHVTVL